MVTRDEQHLTRGRANMLREILTHTTKSNPFDHKELYNVWTSAFHAKRARLNVPQTFDITKLKAEFLQHYYESNPVPAEALLIANIPLPERNGFPYAFSDQFHVRKDDLVHETDRLLGKRAIPKLYGMTLSAMVQEAAGAEEHRQACLSFQRRIHELQRYRGRHQSDNAAYKTGV